jgi:hypothetical protein
VRTVELLPDAALDAAVRDAWARLAAAGLPSLGRHPHPTNRPHLTLASAPELPPLDPVLGALPVPVRLAGVLAFGGERGALAWAVVPSRALLDLHAGVAAALDLPDDSHHAPGRWTPHLSLALRTTPQERAAAVALLAGLPEVDGAFTAARSYDGVTRTTRHLP